MKGIILAGGRGSRLFPLTLVASKQLQAVYDKPMVYYPVTTLLENGIRELCVISTEEDLPHFRHLFGSGTRLGISVEYLVQARPNGIAEAFLIAADFICDSAVCLILGDNICYGSKTLKRAFKEFKIGASIFGYEVQDPQRYGVVEFRNGKVISIDEKPVNPKSNFAIPGVYLYDKQVIQIARNLKLSIRKELEITDINREYLARGQLLVFRLERGFAWFDAGTSSSLHEAAAYVQTIERRQGIKIGCPEEAALAQNFISLAEFNVLLKDMPDCEYRDYLLRVALEKREKQAPE